MLPGVHDLPPKWDGRTVTWGPWRELRSSIAFHAPAEDLACTRCGLIAEPLTAGGWVQPNPGETFTVDDERRLPSGRVYARGTKEVPAWALLCLCATRCAGCRHDTVHDERTGETWDLGSEDYGPDGSTAITGSLW